MKENRRTARPLKKNSNFEDYRLSEKIRHLLQFKKKIIIVLHVFNIGHISKNDLLLKNMYKYSLFS